MKRILLVMSLALGAAWGCSDKAYDDTEIKNMIEELEGRTAALKDLCDRVNTGIVLVNRLEEARQLNRKVTAVVADSDVSGNVVSYTVSFTDGSALTITCPSDGADGYVGKDGVDAEVPLVGKAQHEGQDCWTLGGEFIKGDDGNPIPLYTYTDGQKTDGRTPELKVDGGRWFYRFSEADDWTPVGIGVLYGDGNIFSSVQEDDDNVIFNLSAGGMITLPKAKQLSLSLDSLSGSIVAGGSLELAYTLETEDEQTDVKVFAPVGWTSSVADGKVTITAAVDAVPGSMEQVIVFATESDGKSVFRIVNIIVEAA